MRIAQVAPPFERVPPVRYGGTERVISYLTEELVRLGHQVTLFATADAETSAELVPFLDSPVWSHNRCYRDGSAFVTLALGRVVREAARFDIIHSHVEHVGFPLARALAAPFITTLHGRLDLPELVPVLQEFSDIPLVSISNAQRGPVAGARWISTVYHGIALDRFGFRTEPGKYLAFLGRISPDKGLDAAIRIARRSGMPLFIAAREPLPTKADAAVQADWAYYEEKVKPLLREPGVEFIGEVSEGEKQAFLGGAAALLFPIAWPEPFGLVMIEALACGTPVLALRRGSVPEVVEDTVTGFIGETEDDLVRAISRLGSIERRQCRIAAEQRFSSTVMAHNYLDVYAQLLQEAEAARPPLVQPPGLPATSLLTAGIPAAAVP